MIENYDLKPISEETEKFDISINDANEGEEVTIKEVYRKGNLILYECKDSDVGQTVSSDVIAELFPNFEIDPMKDYLIEKDGEIFFQ